MSLSRVSLTPGDGPLLIPEWSMPWSNLWHEEMLNIQEDDYAYSLSHFHADVFSVCATHALSTESEEVMGLLLGDIIVGPAVTLVWDADSAHTECLWLLYK